ncbi:MAG: diacylglycerol kinase family lipid kinase [Rhodocyclaceae bacterium]|nr:diacylglycerol kinase family lipid kinase [Rhodocyclaceae bacterium]
MNLSSIPILPAETWLVALNPISGRGRGLHWRSAIEAHLAARGQCFHTVVSGYAGGTVDLVAEAVRRGCRRVLVVGGDGSLSEAVNGLFAQAVVSPAAVTLALLPVGTGNDWGRSHAVPTAPEAAIELAVRGVPRPHDAGVIDFSATGARRWFVNVAGCGFDAAVVERMPSRRWGRLAYLIGLLRGLSAYRMLPLSLTVDGRTEYAQALVAFTCIGSTCGGGMKVAPNARDDDGLLDVTLIHYLKAWEILRDVRRLFDGSLLSHPQVSSWQTNRVELDGELGTPVEADGETVGHLPATVTVVPGALMLVQP